MSRVSRLLVPHRRHPERLACPPDSCFSRIGSESLRGRPPGGFVDTSRPGVRQDSEVASIDYGQLGRRGLKDVAVVMRLDEFAPVGGWRQPTAPNQSLPQPSRPCPTPSIQIQFGVLDALKAPLALVNHLVQDPLARIQVRVPDPVGVLGGRTRTHAPATLPANSLALAKSRLSGCRQFRPPVSQSGPQVSKPLHANSPVT